MNQETFFQELRELLSKYELDMVQLPRIEVQMPTFEKSWDNVVPVCRTVTNLNIRIDVEATSVGPWAEDPSRPRRKLL